VVIGPEHIKFQNVPIIAPAGGAAGVERGGEVLLSSLTLEVKIGQHVLVTGAK
jgi:ATP-binding cassette, subfamily D (ALD), peroxisomal long-chain fatty acid import protein